MLIETGFIGLDDTVRISLKAAHEPPVKLGLRDGQRIKVRYLLRAAGVQELMMQPLRLLRVSMDLKLHLRDD